MTISLNWLKEYVEVDLPATQVAEILTSLGLEVEGLEARETIKGGLEGVVVGHILDTWKHPNADKLTLTKVKVGNGEPLQIVCGAPNVAAGQKVLVALAGTTLYPLAGDPIKLKKGNIRGEASEGMICAEDELGLGHDHSGIMVLPPETPVGMAAKDYLKIETDNIIEIGLTPNRSDATSHVGVARDLAAAMKIQRGHSGAVKLPDLSSFKHTTTPCPVEVIVENTEACPRYTGLCIEGVTVGESPGWLKNRLQAIGQRPINNIVDITNFVLHELGQPLHAFDMDEISGKKIVVKTLPEGTKYISLDGVERSLSAEDLMICDGDSNGMCIGGVFGGLNSGVKDHTKNIFLESAYFHPRWIRRSSTRHDLRTDAARTFEKGVDPNGSLFALKRAAQMMVEIAGGKITSGVVDIYPQPIDNKEVKVTYEYLHRLIGEAIPVEKIKEILLALNMRIVEETSRSITVSVPTNKPDVTRPADVAEEVLRIYGLDNVPVPAHIKSSMVKSERPDPNDIRNAVGDLLASCGFNETMALSLSQSTYYKDILPSAAADLVFVNNTSNVQLDVMRPTMLFSGLEAVAHNQNRQKTDLKLFEFGKTYHQQEIAAEEKDVRKRFAEQQHLALFLTGQREPESWRNQSKAAADFFSLKSFVDKILTRLGMSGFQDTAVKDDVFAYGLKYHRGPQTLVTFGKIQPAVSKKMGIRSEVFYADFDWGMLLQAQKKQTITFAELNKFPTVRRDLALVIGNSVKFSDIAALARKAGKKLLKEVNLFDVFEDETKLGEGKKSYAVSFIFENPTRTLQDKEVDELMGQLIEVYESKLEAVVRR
jgi:phenylalanyl-tRNA synthetase beta chain